MAEDPKIVTEARAQLGTQLAALRVAAGYTQETFALKTAFYGRSSIANIETGRQTAPQDFWTLCDKLLNAEGLLAREHDRIVQLRTSSALQRLSRGGRQSLPATPARAAAVLAVDPFIGPGEARRDEQVTLRPGRFLPGTGLDVQVFPASFDGRVMVQVPPDYHGDPFVARNRRGLVIGAVHSRETDQLYGLDTRHAKRKLAGQATAGGRLLIPSAYLLDDVTSGLLWATANFDDALLNDDRILHEHGSRLGEFHGMQRSSVSRSWATEVSAASAMWLGSDFCARHIIANIDRVADVPAFWTREQRGEEASAWLLFAHKYTYLEQLTERHPAGMTRTFCIPEQAVTASAAGERILLLLAAALMESFGIRCHATHEPEYAAVDGFVLDADRHAIVANWVGTEGLWFVDVTDNRSTIREYIDAHQYVQAHSTLAADTPARRLETLASYLGLNWPSVTRRCAQLAEYGLAGMMEPRSRLLNLAGADRACGFLGDLQTLSR